MQYVRSLGGSVSKTWNSINPATLSGAIDVVVVEHEDGSLACSPFHVRFGKFSLLRPSEKKVEFKVNEVKQEYAMKLGEGGEAFFVFETSDEIPEALQTSPIISAASSPEILLAHDKTSEDALQEPEYLDLSANSSRRRPLSTLLPSNTFPMLSIGRAQSDLGNLTTLYEPPPDHDRRSLLNEWPQHGTRITLERSASEELLPVIARDQMVTFEKSRELSLDARASEPPDIPNTATIATSISQRSDSPTPISTNEAINRAKSLSKKLSISNIPSQVTETGDLMLDMNGYKSNEEDALRAEVIARQILAEELQGNYDIGALIGADDHGNLWIYSSEEAKEAASRRNVPSTHGTESEVIDATSDPGYQSDEGDQSSQRVLASRPAIGLVTPSHTPPETTSAGDPNRNYAKTLRLTSDQLKALNLRGGPNKMTFTVNRATCQAFMYYWSYKVPVVISDIDGTITKSDALGHVLNMIGRDWTHAGVAKLYTDIVANGYNILYLTSRSVGQADTTRAYLNGVSQEGHKLPRGPVILSPDRTMAALRREIYLRKPEVFKMSCLRDISNLFSPHKNPFYAGFGNRFTDALSYRSVNIPSNRIFTINSNAEVSLDLLTLTKYKASYVSIREVVDHFFPPVGLLVKGGGEEFTDFNYWREAPLDIDSFSASDSEGDELRVQDSRSLRSEDEGSEGLEEDDQQDEIEHSYMANSYISRGSYDDAGGLEDSIIESIEDPEFPQRGSLDEEVVHARSPAFNVDDHAFQEARGRSTRVA